VRDGTTFRNNGTVTVAGGSLDFSQSSGTAAPVFNNAGTLVLQDFARVTNLTPTSDAQLNNSGTLRKAGGTGQAVIRGLRAFSNTGTIDVQTGSLIVDDCIVTTSGPFNTAGGAALQFTGGSTVDFGVGASISGAGFTRILDATATLNVNVVAQNVELGLNGLASGTLTGPGNLDVAGTFLWTGGRLSGAGSLFIGRNAQLNIDSTPTGGLTLSQRTITNNGKATWTGTGSVAAGNGGVFNNQAGATFEARTDASWLLNLSGGARPAINNAGTFSKTLGTGSLQIGVPFNQDRADGRRHGHAEPDRRRDEQRAVQRLRRGHGRDRGRPGLHADRRRRLHRRRVRPAGQRHADRERGEHERGRHQLRGHRHERSLASDPRRPGRLLCEPELQVDGRDAGGQRVGRHRRLRSHDHRGRPEPSPDAEPPNGEHLRDGGLDRDD
jgi:hypothetical protein